jgi:hypothetical protein
MEWLARWSGWDTSLRIWCAWINIRWITANTRVEYCCRGKEYIGYSGTGQYIIMLTFKYLKFHIIQIFHVIVVKIQDCYTLLFFLYINVLGIKVNIFTVFKKISKSLNQRSVDRQQFSVCWTGSDMFTACPTFIGHVNPCRLCNAY